MNKEEFLQQFWKNLIHVSDAEREDAVRYYTEYFEEAGPDREAEVVAELGDPWALSCRLAVEGGYVTWEQANSWTPPKKKKWPWIMAAAVVDTDITIIVQVVAEDQDGHLPIRA